MKKIFVLSLVLLGALQMFAQDYYTPKPYTGRKHRGFYLSMGLGANTTNMTSVSKNYGTSTFKGPGAIFDLKIGGTIGQNLILHATLLSHGVTGPKIESDFWGIEETKTDNKYNISEGMIGGGLTYYTFDNFMFSGSLGFGGFTVTDERENYDFTTDNGISFQLKTGKEWWVSPKWALGVAVYYHHTNCLNQKGTFEEERLKSNNFGIVFNATLNGRK